MYIYIVVTLFQTKRMLDVVQGKLSDANARIVQLEDKLRMAEKGLVVSQPKNS